MRACGAALSRVAWSFDKWGTLRALRTDGLVVLSSTPLRNAVEFATTTRPLRHDFCCSVLWMLLKFLSHLESSSSLLEREGGKQRFPGCESLQPVEEENSSSQAFQRQESNITSFFEMVKLLGPKASLLIKVRSTILYHSHVMNGLRNSWTCLNRIG